MKDLKHLNKALKNITLSEDEKLAGRAALLRHMEANPLPDAPGFWARFYNLTRRPIWATATAAVLLVAFTGTATYASESALPGDLLYDFKVNVVEEVQAGLIFDDEKKAEWEANRIEKRLDEAQQLKDQGKLNPENKFKIRMHLKDHEEEFKHHLEDLKDDGKPDRAENMEEKYKLILQEQEQIREDWTPELQIQPFPVQNIIIENEEVIEIETEDDEADEEERDESTDTADENTDDESEGDEGEDEEIKLEEEIKLDTELEFEFELKEELR